MTVALALHQYLARPPPGRNLKTRAGRNGDGTWTEKTEEDGKRDGMWTEWAKTGRDGTWTALGQLLEPFTEDSAAQTAPHETPG